MMNCCWWWEVIVWVQCGDVEGIVEIVGVDLLGCVQVVRRCQVEFLGELVQIIQVVLCFGWEWDEVWVGDYVVVIDIVEVVIFSGFIIGDGGEGYVIIKVEVYVGVCILGIIVLWVVESVVVIDFVMDEVFVQVIIVWCQDVGVEDCGCICQRVCVYVEQGVEVFVWCVEQLGMVSVFMVFVYGVGNVEECVVDLVVVVLCYD